jgi:hypothetical protein
MDKLETLAIDRADVALPGSITQPTELGTAATGAWAAEVLDTVACDVSIAPRVSTQTSRQAAKTLCSIRVSNFMMVLRE